MTPVELIAILRKCTTAEIQEIQKILGTGGMISERVDFRSDALNHDSIPSIAEYERSRKGSPLEES